MMPFLTNLTSRFRSVRMAGCVLLAAALVNGCGRFGYTTTDGGTAIDVPSVTDTPGPDGSDAGVDAIVDTMAPPDAIDAQDAGVVETGGACMTMSVCASSTDCFGFSGGSFCSDCGDYGQRGCNTGTRCRVGTYNVAADMCVHDPPSSAPGAPGGSCTRQSDCGTPGQCYQNLCIACGSLGQACCCNGSCACNGALTCATGSSGNWTVCH
jgi:hypothetical protein